MENTDTCKRFKQLADTLRRGQGTPAMKAEYQQLEMEDRARRQPTIHRSIWDLPIAKRMWEGDARDVEK